MPGTNQLGEMRRRLPEIVEDLAVLVSAESPSVAEEIGLSALDGVAVGGGSDGNLTAEVGTPTLDGLGAVGGNAHAEGEWVLLPAMAERAVLLRGLIARLAAANDRS